VKMIQELNSLLTCLEEVRQAADLGGAFAQAMVTRQLMGKSRFDGRKNRCPRERA
jgi:hypothetical protein